MQARSRAGSCTSSDRSERVAERESGSTRAMLPTNTSHINAKDSSQTIRFSKVGWIVRRFAHVLLQSLQAEINVKHTVPSHL